MIDLSTITAYVDLAVLTTQVGYAGGWWLIA